MDLDETDMVNTDIDNNNIEIKKLARAFFIVLISVVKCSKLTSILYKS